MQGKANVPSLSKTSPHLQVFRVDTIYEIAGGNGGNSCDQLQQKRVSDSFQELADYLVTNEKVDPSDVEAYIEDILDEDFDTNIEDGTVGQLGTLMVNLTKQCRNGSIQEALEQLPKTRPALPDARPEPSQTVDDEDMVDVSEISDVADQVRLLYIEHPFDCYAT